MTPFETDLVAAQPRLRVYALRLTRSPIQAEDFAQEVLTRALRYRDAFAIGTNMWAWLCQITRNAWVDDRRRAWRMVVVDPIMVDHLASFPDGPGRLDLADGLAALALLPARMGRVLAAAAIDDLSYGEIAEIEGCPVGTVKSLICRGRAQLREQVA